MVNEDVLTKKEIYAQIERYRADPESAMSWTFFAELAGMSVHTLQHVFVKKDLPMSIETQIKVSRALKRLAAGEVKVVYNKDRSRKLVYNQQNRPRIARSMQVDLQGGKLCLKVGLRNKSDYSQPTLREKLKGK
jgi:hypothetical protein